MKTMLAGLLLVMAILSQSAFAAEVCSATRTGMGTFNFRCTAPSMVLNHLSKRAKKNDIALIKGMSELGYDLKAMEKSRMIFVQSID